MGKSFKGFQRHLSVILTIAMIFTMMPTPAYADELIGGDSEDILISDEVISDETVIEEESDALISDDVDTLISDDDSSIDIRNDSSSAADADDNLDGNTAGEEDISQDKSTGDVKLTFVFKDGGEDRKVSIFDPDSYNGDQEYSSPVAWDSTKAFEFTLTPDLGYKLNESETISAYYQLETNGEKTIVANTSDGITYDKATGKATVSTVVLGTYKTDSQDKEDAKFVIEIPENMAVIDPYDVTIIGAKVAEGSSKTVSVNGKAHTIALEAEKADERIESVKVYTKYVSEDSEENEPVKSLIQINANTGHMIWDFTAGDGKLKFTDYNGGYAIREGYKAGKSLIVVAKTVKKDQFTLSQTEDKYGNVLKFYNVSGNEITVSDNYTQDITVSLNSTVADRIMNQVTATITYKGVETPKTITGSALVDSDNIGITADKKSVTMKAKVLTDSGNKATDIKIGCTTYDKIDIKSSIAEGTKLIPYIGFMSMGDDESKTYYGRTGGSVKFKVEPVNVSDIVKSVGYKLGDSETVTPLTKGEDGYYTIENITDTITIVTEADEIKGDTPVALDGGSSEAFVVKDFATGYAILSDNNVGYATAGKDYFFTVDSPSGIEIGKVTYEINGKKTEVTAEDGKYKIPASRSDGYITICVTAKADMIKVTAPENSLAKLYVGGAAKTGYFYINKADGLSFTVVPAASTAYSEITVDEVKYKIGNQTKTVTKGNNGYKVTLSANDLTGDVTVSAKATAVAKEGTYSVSLNVVSDCAYDEDGTLKIALADKAVLAPVLKIGESNNVTFASAVYSSGSETDDIISVNKVAVENKPDNAAVTGKSRGTDSLVAKLTTAYDKNGDRRVYNKTVNVSVTDRYVVTLSYNDLNKPFYYYPELADVKGTQNRIDAVKLLDSDNRKVVTAIVKNAATGQAVSANDMSKAIIRWSSANPDFVLNKTTDWAAVTADSIEALVGAQAVGQSDITVTIRDDETDKTEYTARISVEAVEKTDEPEYTFYPTVTINGKKELITNIDQKKNDTFDLVASSEAMSSATVELRVLQYVDKEKYKTIVEEYKGKYSGYESLDHYVEVIEAALEAGALIDITNNDDTTIEYKDSTITKDSASYYTIKDGKNKGDYIVSITDKGNSIKLSCVAKVGGELVESGNVTFNAIKSMPKARIGIAVDDDENIADLPAEYLTKYSDYTEGYDDKPANAYNGYTFKAEGGSEFVLPVSADNIDTTRILLGWKCVSTNGLDDDDDDDEYDVVGLSANDLDGKTYRAGEFFEVPYVWPASGSYEPVSIVFAPIWADRVVTYVSENNVYAESVAFRGTKPAEEAELALSENRTFKVLDTEDGIPVSIVLKRNNGFTTDPDTGDVEIVSGNYLFPNETVGIGSVHWYAYDKSVSANIGEGKKYADAVAAAADVTVVDKASLDNGLIKGKKAGDAVLFAVYTDEAGNTWHTESSYEITVEARPRYSVQKGSIPATVSVDQITTIENAVSVVKDGVVGVVDTSDGTIKYTITEGGEYATISANETDPTTIKIEGLKAGKVKFTATYTDKDGVTSAPSDEMEITVAPSPYKISVTNSKGVSYDEIPTIEVKADEENFATDLYLTVTRDGVPVSLNGMGDGFEVVKGNKIFTGDDEATRFDLVTVSGSNLYLYRLTGSTAKGLAADTVNMTLTKDKVTYKYAVPMKNYYELTFDGSKSVMVSGNTAEAFDKKEKYEKVAIISPDDKDDLVADGVGYEVHPKNKYVRKIYADEVNTSGKAELSLAGYGAEYVGDKTAITFAGWTEAVSENKTPECTKPDKVVKDKVIVDVNGDQVIAPQFVCTPVDTISLQYSEIEIEQTSLEDSVKKSVKISTSPDKSEIRVNASTDVVLEDEIDGWYKMGDGSDDTVSKSSIDLKGRATGNLRESVLTIESKPGRIGTDTIKISAGNPDVVKSIKLNIYGLHKVNVESVEKIKYRNSDGQDEASKAVKVGDNMYYFDENGYKFADDYSGVVWDVSGNKILLNKGKQVTGGAKKVDNINGNSYYIDRNNRVVLSQLVPPNQTTQYYAGPDGVLVTYDMTVKAGTAGVYTDGGKKYLIATNDTAKLYDVYYAPVVTWNGDFPTTITKDSALPSLSYNVVYQSMNYGEKEVKNVPATVSANSMKTISDNWVKVTLTATADLSAYSTDVTGTTKADNVVKSQVYTFKYGGTTGEAKEYTYKSHEFKWPKLAPEGKNMPAVTATVTYTVKEAGKTETTEEVESLSVNDVTVKSITPKVSENKAFTATITLYDNSTKTDSKEYTIKSVTPEVDDQKEDSEPTETAEGRENVNIFYNNADDTVELEIPVPEDGNVDLAKVNSKAKWTTYWTYDNGTVTLKKGADRAKAVKNNVITLPLVDNEDKEIGEYEYTLPVTYVKPVLKLSSKTGTIYTASIGYNGQTVYPQVLVKKSNNLFSPLDLTEYDDDQTLWATKKGSATAGIEEAKTGTIAVTARSASKGTISVKLDNWSQKIDLDYVVKAVAKDTITVSKKQVTLNSNANYEAGLETLDVYVEFNGAAAKASDSISVEYPKNWASSNVTVTGITNKNILNGNKLSFSYNATKVPVKGNYIFKLTKGKAKASVKVVVSNVDLDKTIKLKRQTPLNPVTDQKMVLIPTLKGVDGTINNVAFDGNEKQFGVDYNADLNQILISLNDGYSISSKAVTKTLIVTVGGGIDCPVKVKIQPKITKPKVKIDKVKLPKSGLVNGTAVGTANVLSTYKLGFKTYAIAPKAVKFIDGVAADEELGEGWYKVAKAHVAVKYNEDDGTISIQALSGNTRGKGGSVKVEVSYGSSTNTYVTIKKNLSIGVDTKK